MRKRFWLRLLGYLFCLVPPIAAILERFPLWAREGGAPVVSGIAFLLLVVAVIPLRRGLTSLLRRFLESPSAFGIWGVLFLLCEWLDSILAAVADIALVGAVSSLLGAILFRLSERGVNAREP